MYIKQEMYRGKLTPILYADEGYLLQHKETHLIYGSVSLEEDRKESDYEEIKEKSPEHEME
jgi:hypothetical protein